jgi:hypothetical protein
MSVAGCEWVLDRALNRPSREITLPPPPPERLARPVFVVVEGDRIIVEMDDGAQCLGPARDAFSPAGWTGTFTECAYPYTYAVALALGSPAEPIVLNEVVGTPLPLEEGEVPFRPIASVRITDTAGFSYRFESAEGF